jgi:hypothetical protein
MQAPNQTRKKRGKLYFSSSKALKTSRMGRKKLAPERYETKGINKILDFEDKEENLTLSTVDESQCPSTSRERGSQSRGASRDMGTQSNPASNPATEEHSMEDELEETSLMEQEGGFLKP